MWRKLPQHLKVSDHQRHYIGKNKLAASHRRCRDAGVDPELERIGGIHVDSVFQTGAVSQYTDLIPITRRCFEDVHLTMRDRSCIFILTDSEARVVDMFSLPEILYSCSLVGLVPGASFKEGSCGTNAVALALHHGEPIVTSGEHHFCKIFKDWSFIAVPVYGAACEPVACIALACSHESGISEKLPLLKMMAEKIENGIYGDRQAEQTSADCSKCPNKNVPATNDDSVNLSHCQSLVFSLVIEGHCYKEIAEKLNISSHTVNTHMERLRKKLGVKTTVEMVAKYANKVVSTPPPEHANQISNIGNVTYNIDIV